MRGTITYIMVAPVLLSAKVLEITYCSTPLVILGIIHWGGVPPFMLWGSLIDVYCVWLASHGKGRVYS